MRSEETPDPTHARDGFPWVESEERSASQPLPQPAPDLRRRSRAGPSPRGAAGAAPIGPRCPAAPAGQPRRDRDSLALGRLSPRALAQADKLPTGSSPRSGSRERHDPSEKIKGLLLSRVGQPLDQQKVNADLKTLMGKVVLRRPDLR